MRFVTLKGRAKDIPIKPYLVDWEGEQGSRFSEEVLDFLYPFWRHDIVVAEFPVAGTKMRYDFINLNRKVIIETDGIQHDQYSPHFHGSLAAYRAQMGRDMAKDHAAELNGLKMVRIVPTDLPLSRDFFRARFDILL